MTKPAPGKKDHILELHWKEQGQGGWKSSEGLSETLAAGPDPFPRFPDAKCSV